MADMGISAILLGLSAAASVAGGVTSAMAAADTAKNEKLNAQQAEAAGIANMNRQRRIVASQLAQQHAEAGSYGLVTNIGSPMEAYIETVKQGEITALDELQKGKMQKQTALQQMRNAQAAGTSGLISGVGQAAGTLGSARRIT